MDARVVVLKLERLFGILKTQRKFQELEIESEYALVNFMEKHLEGLAKVKESQKAINTLAFERRSVGMFDRFAERQNSSPSVINLKESITNSHKWLDVNQSFVKKSLLGRTSVTILDLKGNVNLNFSRRSKRRAKSNMKKQGIVMQNLLFGASHQFPENSTEHLTEDTPIKPSTLTKSRARFSSEFQPKEEASSQTTNKSSSNDDHTKSSRANSSGKRHVAFAKDNLSTPNGKLKERPGPSASGTGSKNSPSIYSKTSESKNPQSLYIETSTGGALTTHIYLNRHLGKNDPEMLKDLMSHPTSSNGSPKTSMQQGMLFRRLSRQLVGNQPFQKSKLEPEQFTGVESLFKTPLVSRNSLKIFQPTEYNNKATRIELFNTPSVSNNLN